MTYKLVLLMFMVASLSQLPAHALQQPQRSLRRPTLDMAADAPVCHCFQCPNSKFPIIVTFFFLRRHQWHRKRLLRRFQRLILPRTSWEREFYPYQTALPIFQIPLVHWSLQIFCCFYLEQYLLIALVLLVEHAPNIKQVISKTHGRNLWTHLPRN